MSSPFLTLDQARELLGHRSTNTTRMFLNRWVKADRIYIGRERRVTRDQVLEAIERCSKARRRRGMRMVRRAG